MSVDSTQVVQSLLTIPSAVSTESTDNGGNEMQQYFVVSNLITVLFASQQGAGNDRANPRLGASGGSSISGSVDSLDGLTEVPPITLDPNRAPTDKVSATMQGMGILAFYDLAMKNGSLTPKLKDWIIHRLNCILGSGFLDPQFKDIITKGAGAVNEGSSLADKISWGAKDEKIDPLQILVAKIILWAADWKNNTMAQPDEDTLAASVFLFQDLGTTDNDKMKFVAHNYFIFKEEIDPVHQGWADGLFMAHYMMQDPVLSNDGIADSFIKTIASTSSDSSVDGEFTIELKNATSKYVIITNPDGSKSRDYSDYLKHYPIVQVLRMVDKLYSEFVKRQSSL